MKEKIAVYMGGSTPKFIDREKPLDGECYDAAQYPPGPPENTSRLRLPPAELSAIGETNYPSNP